MLIENYINDIFDSPPYVFDQIVEKIIGENIKQAKSELERTRIDVDVLLFKKIKTLLKELREEEGAISSFFYTKFGLELQKNKQREELIYLRSQLKAQHSKIEAERFRIHEQRERISLCIEDLNKIADALEGKKFSFTNQKVLIKRRYCMREINIKIESLTEYELSLDSKYNSLGDTEKMYNFLLQKIPIYHKLEDETYLV